VKLSCGEEEVEVRIEGDMAFLAGRKVPFRASRSGGRLESLRIGQERFRIRAARDGERVFVWCAGQTREFGRAAIRRRRRGDVTGSLAAPMPGRVGKVLGIPGKQVSQGDVVLVLEAMKMEHAIRAPRDGTVTRIFHGEGDLVEAGEELAEIESL
jgi:3-methylcrotonyl-CoA carboxylase alpha subunit